MKPRTHPNLHFVADPPCLQRVREHLFADERSSRDEKEVEALRLEARLLALFPVLSSEKCENGSQAEERHLGEHFKTRIEEGQPRPNK